MNNLFSQKTKERGEALSGIVIIILILVLGGMYFYKMTKSQAEANKALREKTETTEVLTASEQAPKIRADLDYKIEASEAGVTVEKNLDAGSYNFSEKSGVYMQTQEVNKTAGTVSMVFRPTTGKDVMTDSIKTTPLTSSDSIFTVPLNQVFTAKVGQTVKLKGSTIQIKLLEITGAGCPPGAMC